jgi:hypothetical protein
MNSMTRTIRLAVGATAALVLMTQAAQARPINPQSPAPERASVLVQKGTYMPVSPATNVAAAHAVETPTGAAQSALGRLEQVTPPTQAVAVTSAAGFDWFAAAIGAGSVLAVLLIAAAAMTAHGRRRDPLSA